MRFMKTKIILIFALVLGGLSGLTSSARGADDIKIMLDIPSYGWDGTVTQPPELQNRYPGYDHFYVIIENVSDKTIFLAEGNGEINGLSFEIVTANHKTVIMRRVQTFTKYVTGEFAVPPGQAKVEEVYYNRDWTTFPFPQNTTVTDNKTMVSIRAVLANAGQDYFKGCWTGKAVSEPYQVTLLNNAIEN